MALAPQVPLQQIVPTWSGPDCLLDLSVIAKVCPNIKGNLGSVPFTLGAIVNGFVTITPTPGGAPNQPIHDYCGKGGVTIDISVLGLVDVEVEAYLKLLGLLDLNVDVDILGLVKIGSGKKKAPLPSCPQNFRTVCGSTLEKYTGSPPIRGTCTDHLDCLKQCAGGAVHKSYTSGKPTECMGATVKYGKNPGDKNQCLYWLGAPDALIDINIAVKVDVFTDSFCV